MVTRDRERTIRVVSIVLTLVAVSGFVSISDGTLATSVRSLLGVDDRQRPAVESGGGRSFEFLATQPGSGVPVGFSPCREIEYVVSPDAAPDGWEDDVASAIAEVGDRTGLRFEYGGETDDRDFTGRGPDEPVLIGWADDGEVDDLTDDVIGVGGPVVVTVGNRSYLAGGSVVIDTDFTEEAADSLFGDDLERALLLHELGHLVGLDHVDDPNEIMYPRGPTRSDFGPGDRAGLARVGAIPCR